MSATHDVPPSGDAAASSATPAAAPAANGTDTPQAPAPRVRRASVNHRPLLTRLLIFTAGSFVFGFALAPLYDVLCKVWDAGNRWYGTQTAEASVVQRPVTDRLVTIEFIANVPNSGHWEFHPHVATMQVHPGKLYSTTYYAKNRSGEAVVRGTLVPQDGVLLLHSAEFREGRGPRDARAFHRRSGAAGRRGPPDALVLVLRHAAAGEALSAPRGRRLRTRPVTRFR